MKGRAVPLFFTVLIFHVAVYRLLPAYSLVDRGTLGLSDLTRVTPEPLTCTFCLLLYEVYDQIDQKHIYIC